MPVSAVLPFWGYAAPIVLALVLGAVFVWSRAASDVVPLGMVVWWAVSAYWLFLTADLELSEGHLWWVLFGRARYSLPLTEIRSMSAIRTWLSPHNRVVIDRIGARPLTVPMLTREGAELLVEAFRVETDPIAPPTATPVLDPPTAAPLLLRRDQTLDQWIAHLRRLGDGASVRGPAIPREQLWEFAEGTASLRVRVAAVVALSGVTATEEERDRLSALAHTTDDATLQAAFELAADPNGEVRIAMEALADELSLPPSRASR